MSFIKTNTTFKDVGGTGRRKGKKLAMLKVFIEKFFIKI
jgi:hypothetical protein